jgi:hypothetical protein
VIRLVDKFFRADDKEAVIKLLAEQCGNNLPFLKEYEIQELDRIRFAAVKVSNGNIVMLEAAVHLAKADWRDLLIAADFAADTDSHNNWANTVLKISLEAS